MDFRIVLATCVALTVMCRASRGQVDASLLRPGVDSLAYYVVDRPDTIRSGTLRQELQVQQSDDQRRVVLVSARLIAGREPSVDTLILAFDGLRPIAESGSWYSVVYTEGRAVGWVLEREGDSVAVDVSLPSGTISAESFELVLRASNLQSGASFDMLGFFPRTALYYRDSNQPPPTVPLQARVTGIEDVHGTPCWVVEIDPVRGGLPVTLWIDQQTRALRRKVVRLEPGVEWLYSEPLEREREMERERLAREQAEQAVQIAISTRWRPVLQDVLIILGDLVRAHNREAGTAFQVDLPPLPANLYQQGQPYLGVVTFADSTYWWVRIGRSLPARESDPSELTFFFRRPSRPASVGNVAIVPQPAAGQLLVRVRASTPDAPTSFLPRTIALPDYQEGLAAVLQRLVEWQVQLLDDARPPD